MEAEGALYQDMERLVALERGLRTWAKWVDANVDKSKTRLFFQSISPTHYKYVHRYILFSLSLLPFFSLNSIILSRIILRVTVSTFRSCFLS